MGTADIDTGSLRGVLHFYDVDLDTLRGFEDFALHLLILGQHGICLTQVDADIFADIALHYTGYYILFLLIILIVDHASLFFTDLL